MTGRSIESAYAGGVRGREVIDRLLPDISVGFQREGDEVDPEDRRSILSTVGKREQSGRGYGHSGEEGTERKCDGRLFF